MNNKRMLALIIPVVVIAAIGCGYAWNLASVSVSDENEVSFTPNTVEILNSDDTERTSFLPISNPSATINGNEVTIQRNTTYVTGYKLKVSTSESEGLKVRSWVMLNDPRSWAMIESITLTVGDTSTDLYSYTVHDSSAPSAVFTLQDGTYDLSLSITYRNVTFDLNGVEDNRFIVMDGSKLVFAAGETDPLTPSDD